MKIEIDKELLVRIKTLIGDLCEGCDNYQEGRSIEDFIEQEAMPDEWYEIEKILK